MIADVIRLKSMLPKCYLFDRKDERYRLYLGGMSTIAGLGLFPACASVANCELYTNARHVRTPEDSTVSEAIRRLNALPDVFHMVDFSCVIDSDITFSTHDDAECHFVTTSLDRIAAIVDASVANALWLPVWDILQSHCGCYLVFRSDGSFTAYPNFDAYLASEDVG